MAEKEIKSPKEIEPLLGHREILRWASLLVNYLTEYPAHFREDQINIFLKSPPGTGKTAWAFALRERLRSPKLFGYLVVSNIDPSEFGGATFAQQQENGDLVLKTISRAEFYRLSEEARASNLDGENKILFFDELGNAPGYVQSAVLNGISSGQWGGYRLRRPFTVIATGNPVDASETAQPIAEPMRRRFIFFNLPEPDIGIYFSACLNHIGSGNFSPGYITSQSQSSMWDFPSVPSPETIYFHRLAWAKLIGAFSIADETMLDQRKNLEENYEDYGWDSPASRETLVQALSVLSAAEAPELMIRLCAYGTIGVSATNRFFALYPSAYEQATEIAKEVQRRVSLSIEWLEMDKRARSRKRKDDEEIGFGEGEEKASSGKKYYRGL